MRELNVVKAIVLILLLAAVLPTGLSYAAEPTEPRAADAIWLEPSLVELSADTVPPGYKFNVTVWANCSVACGGWQVWLLYEKGVINATRAGYTGPGGAKSDFFQNLSSTIPVASSFKSHNDTHNRVESGESWGGVGPYRDAGHGSLCWIEFNITSVPEEAEIILEFYAFTGAVRRTYIIEGPTSQKVDLNAYGGVVTFEPPPPDEIPPTIVLLSPTNKTYTINTTVLKFTISELASWIGYSLNDEANVTITGNTTLTFTDEGSYKVTVYANDTSGNMGASNTVYFTVLLSLIPGDMDGDGDVEIDDLYEAAHAFGSAPGHPRWNELADIDGDGYVGILDMFMIAENFGIGS